MKEPHRIDNPPLFFGDFMRAQPQGCFVCQRTCPTHKAATEVYNKAHGSKKRASANVCETKVEVSKDDLSKMMIVGSKLLKEIQEIKRAWAPKHDKDKDREKDKKGKGRWRKKGNGVNEVTAEENTPTNNAQ